MRLVGNTSASTPSPSVRRDPAAVNPDLLIGLKQMDMLVSRYPTKGARPINRHPKRKSHFLPAALPEVEVTARRCLEDEAEEGPAT